MNKGAKANYPIHDILQDRWSPRAFETRPVEKEKLQRIFEAARWAPSASNEQPWAFVVGQNKDDTWQGIYDSLVEFNQLWTQFAPILVATFGRKINLKGSRENLYRGYDVGQSVAHLSFEAHHEGLHVHQMGGFDKEKIEKSFQVPDDWEALTTFAVGYIGDPEILHPNLRKLEYQERERFPSSGFVFNEKFGSTVDWL